MSASIMPRRYLLAFSAVTDGGDAVTGNVDEYVVDVPLFSQAEFDKARAYVRDHLGKSGIKVQSAITITGVVRLDML